MFNMFIQFFSSFTPVIFVYTWCFCCCKGLVLNLRNQFSYWSSPQPLAHVQHSTRRMYTPRHPLKGHKYPHRPLFVFICLKKYARPEFWGYLYERLQRGQGGQYVMHHTLQSFGKAGEAARGNSPWWPELQRTVTPISMSPTVGARCWWFLIFLSFSANAAIVIMNRWNIRWTWPFRMTNLLTITARKWFAISRPTGAFIFPGWYSAISNIGDMARAWKSWSNPQIIFSDFAKLLNKETIPLGSFSRTLLNLLNF